VYVYVYLVGLLKENKLIKMHGISNLKVKNTGCYMSLTYATSIHYPPLTHTHTHIHTHTRAHALKTHTNEHMFKVHTFHKPKKCTED
jgi:hypothetical protein